VVELYHAYQSCQSDIDAAREMAGDPEMREFAEAEIKQGEARLEQLNSELQVQLLPKDPNDERSVFLEVRAGTGGDEAALFAGDLFRMYTRFAERKRWQVEVVSESPGEMGGYKEIIARTRRAGCLLGAEIRIRRTSRAACADHRNTGPCTYIWKHR